MDRCFQYSVTELYFSVREMAGFFYGGLLFLSFLAVLCFCLFLLFCYCVFSVKLHVVHLLLFCGAALSVAVY
jgi:hypothetical protein